MARAHRQRDGRRIGVWASNYDDVYILKFYSQVTFPLSGLKVIYSQLYLLSRSAPLNHPISTRSMATEKKEKLERKCRVAVNHYERN